MSAKVSLGDRIAYYVIAALCVGIACAIVRLGVWFIPLRLNTFFLHAALFSLTVAFFTAAIELYGYASSREALAKRFKSIAYTAFSIGMLGFIPAFLTLFF